MRLCGYDSHSSRRNGLTMLEVLVVGSITVLLAALSLPAIQKARESARSSGCRANLKNIGMAFRNYYDVHNQFPPPYTTVRGPLLTTVLNDDGLPGPDNPDTHTFNESLLPFLDQMNLFKQIDFSSPAASPVDFTPIGLRNYTFDNQSILSVAVPTFVCPSVHRTSDTGSVVQPDFAAHGVTLTTKSGFTDYTACGGVLGQLNVIIRQVAPQYARNGVLHDRDYRMTIPKIKDGLSNTLLLGELAGRSNIYRKGVLMSSLGIAYGGLFAEYESGENWFGGSLFDGSGQGPCVINCTNENGHGLYSFHPGGANVLLCDGSVKFLSETLYNVTFANLVTPDGEQLTGSF